MNLRIDTVHDKKGRERFFVSVVQVDGTSYPLHPRKTYKTRATAEAVAAHEEFINYFDPFCEREEETPAQMLYNLKELRKELLTLLPDEDSDDVLKHLNQTITVFENAGIKEART